MRRNYREISYAAPPLNLLIRPDEVFIIEPHFSPSPISGEGWGEGNHFSLIRSGSTASSDFLRSTNLTAHPLLHIMSVVLNVFLVPLTCFNLFPLISSKT